MDMFWGHGSDLTVLQMSVRAAVMAFVALGLIRLAGMRTFGSRSAIDLIVVIMLGAVLSRAVVGASPFLPTVAASTVIVVIHRLVAHLAMRHARLARIVKGEERLLYSDGRLRWRAMNRSSISRDDLVQAVRLEANLPSLAGVDKAYIESNGRISIVKKAGAARALEVNERGVGMDVGVVADWAADDARAGRRESGKGE